MHAMAAELGFDLCGIAPSRKLTEREAHLRRWTAGGMMGSLGYMPRNLDKRLDPSLLVDGARSVVVCAMSYRRTEHLQHEVASRIASYALTTDYHITVRERLHALLKFIGDRYGARGRVFVDTAPILEKSWACEAGLGWTGRNSLVVNPELGSFIILGLVVTDAVLEYDAPYGRDGCKGCRKCIEACPGGGYLGRPFHRRLTLHIGPYHRVVRDGRPPRRPDLRLRHLSVRMPVQYKFRRHGQRSIRNASRLSGPRQTTLAGNG